MEVIFNHQIHHQRDVIGTIGRARRKWRQLYHWFPEQQRILYKEMDRIYKETREKYDKDAFMIYSQERRLNKRIIKNVHQHVHDKEDYQKFACLKPILDKYNRFPLLYYYEECGKPGFCQQQKNAVM
ncbi:hypothetical protein FF38_06536 [Lucilia cuprina]|uniref:Uncharacterized protein n=1 Tax=Lucilia cuprina TaxID=7375 RepID=A0A0L0C4X5_LUCCU|nr:hypothetical protein FF38_06536 [Lucilia cuprina]